MNEDRCVCCGEIIPEGRWVCQNCQAKKEQDKLSIANAKITLNVAIQHIMNKQEDNDELED